MAKKDPLEKALEEQTRLLKEQRDLLQEQLQMIGLLVQAEYTNAQASEALLKSFEGSSGNKTFDRSMEQMMRLGGHIPKPPTTGVEAEPG